MLKLLFAYLTLLSSTLLASTAPIEVKVGGYLFPPFVQIKNQAISGLTVDLIELLNEQQSEFIFTFIPTSPKRRYLDFQRGSFDAIFFENKTWSWENQNIDQSDVFLSGGEVFFTKKAKGRDQSYFQSIKDKKVVAILGYHYRFLDNTTDVKTLKQQYKINLVSSPKTVINQVLSGKADVGIATYSYLQEQIKQNPTVGLKLLVSENFDQTYQHCILIRRNHPLNLEKVNQLLNKIQSNGTLLKLLAKYGLTPL